MNEFVETLLDVRFAEPKRSYDVVIIGGGGHCLSTAYHLAARHGITNVAVLERGYIGSGNSGRNTTIIRANYGLPEAVRFYQHSLELYQRLEDETGCDVMHASKGILWLAHSITTARTEQGRALLNTACGAKTTPALGRWPSTTAMDTAHQGLSFRNARVPSIGSTTKSRLQPKRSASSAVSSESQP